MKNIILINAFIVAALAQNIGPEVSVSPTIISINYSYEECQDYFFHGDRTKQSVLLIDLDHESFVHINIYNKRSGKLVENLKSGILQQGRNEIYWNGRDSNGEIIEDAVYFHICRLEKI